jgi:hypothetical protein
MGNLKTNKVDIFGFPNGSGKTICFLAPIISMYDTGVITSAEITTG